MLLRISCFSCPQPQEAEARDFGNFEGVWPLFMHTVLRIDYVLVFWKDLGLSAMGPQKLIKHMTSRPGSHRQRLRFVNGIERSASTERPLPGNACSFWGTLGAPGTYKTHDFEARPFDIENALRVWNRAFCLDRTTTSWRGIFFRRKNRWPQQTWKSRFYRIYGASQRHTHVRLSWIEGKPPLWILTFFFGNFQTSTSLLK